MKCHFETIDAVQTAMQTPSSDMKRVFTAKPPDKKKKATNYDLLNLIKSSN